MTEQLHFHFSLSCSGEGNGNPLQCSCLENPRDGLPSVLPSMGSHRVRLKWLSSSSSMLRVCLVDLVDLIGHLYSWWEGFVSSSLATLPLGFNCGFISSTACGSSTGVCSWGCSGGLGSSPVRARCGGGDATWVAGVLAAPGAQGSWRLGKQEI